MLKSGWGSCRTARLWSVRAAPSPPVQGQVDSDLPCAKSRSVQMLDARRLLFSEQLQGQRASRAPGSLPEEWKQLIHSLHPNLLSGGRKGTAPREPTAGWKPHTVHHTKVPLFGSATHPYHPRRARIQIKIPLNKGRDARSPPQPIASHESKQNRFARDVARSVKWILKSHSSCVTDAMPLRKARGRQCADTNYTPPPTHTHRCWVSSPHLCSVQLSPIGACSQIQ